MFVNLCSCLWVARAFRRALLCSCGITSSKSDFMRATLRQHSKVYEHFPMIPDGYPDRHVFANVQFRRADIHYFTNHVCTLNELIFNIVRSRMGPLRTHHWSFGAGFRPTSICHDMLY